MFSAVVFGAGRTGSHLIKHNLNQYFKSNLVITTHNPLLKLSTNDTIPVISRRRNMFDAILSMFVASKLDKFHFFKSDSSTINIDPFAIDTVSFEGMFEFQTAFYRAIESRKFTNSIEVFYEDILLDSKYLFSKFGHDHQIKDLIIKSPYDVKSLITNIEQLSDLYRNLDSKGISEQSYNFFIETVENDLKNIQEEHNYNRYQQKIK